MSIFAVALLVAAVILVQVVVSLYLNRASVRVPKPADHLTKRVVEYNKVASELAHATARIGEQSQPPQKWASEERAVADALWAIAKALEEKR